jgi:hypothetical protein
MSTLDGDRPKKLDFKRQRDEIPAMSLTPGEVAEIREQARLKVAVEMKDKEHARLLQEFIDDERRAHVPEQQTQPLCLDLAPSMPYIMLDGTQYMHGHLYYVTAGVMAVLIEQMNRGWAHEEITQVRDNNNVRRRPPAHVGVSNFMGDRNPRDLRVSSGVLAGSSPANLLGIGR